MKTLFAFLLLLAAAQAQTTVTATVIDPNGNPYANGTVSAYTLVATGQPFKTISPSATSNLGSFSLSLTANTYIFTVCAQSVLQGQQSPNPPPTPPNGIPSTEAAPKQVCFASGPIAISGGSEDISAQLNAVAALLGPRLGSGGGGGDVDQSGLQRTNSPNGTTQGSLVTYDCAHIDTVNFPGFCEVQTTTAGAKNAVGVCIAGCGTSGVATIGTTLSAPCTLDGSGTPGDAVSVSSSVNGFCSDENSTVAQPNVQTVGRIAKANTGGAGTQAQVDFFLGDLFSPGSSSSGNAQITPCTTAGCMIYEPQPNVPTITGDNSTITNGSGSVTMKSLGLTDPNHAGNWFETQGPTPLPAPTNSTLFYVGPSIPTPNSFQLPKAAGAADVNKAWGVTSSTTDGNGNPVDIMGLITAAGTSLPGAGTLLNPSAPTLTVNGTTGATQYCYLVVGAEDAAATFHSAVTSQTCVSNGNATLSSSNSITLSAYGDTTYGYRGYIVLRCTGGATQGIITNGLLAGKKFIDTGLTADGTSCTSFDTSNTTFIWDACMGSSLPGNPSVPGAPCGVDGPPLTPTAFDDECTQTFGSPGDANDPFWAWLNQGSATASWSNGACVLTPDTGSTGYRLLLTPTPASSPWTFVAQITPHVPVNFGRCGLALEESATGKMVEITFQQEQPLTTTATDNGIYLEIKTWSNSTTSADTQFTSYQWLAPVYFKAAYDGTHVTFSYSQDGVGYSQLWTATATTWFTSAPNRIGFESVSGSSTVPTVCDVDYIRRTQ